MKVLLVNEASGYHEYLKRGLLELGHEVVLAMPTGRTLQGRTADYFFGDEGSGLLTKIKRNIAPIGRLGRFKGFDVANFIMGLSAFSGALIKHLDIPLLSHHQVRLSYIGTGCDAFAQLRLRADADELPCRSCSQYDALGQACAVVNTQARSRALPFAHYVRFTVTPCWEYDHAHDSFPNAVHRRIPLPIDSSRITFEPARPRDRPVIVHAPTRRGFKGTAAILAAIELLGRRRSDFDFYLVENLAYRDYLKRMLSCDIHIDQVLSESAGIAALESLAMGKIVVSGNGPNARKYFPFGDESPVIDGSPEPLALADALSDALDRRAMFQELGEQGRRFVGTHHDPVRVAEAFVSLWSSNSQ